MNDYRTIFDRLKLFYNASSDRKIADILGINYNTIKTWSSRGKVPIEKILEKLQNETININWLLTGEGEMFKNTQVTKDIDDIEVNLYEDIYASAGYGSTNSNIEATKTTLSKALADTMNIIRADRVDIIKVLGDSMEPIFYDGEYVVVERVNGIDEVKNGNTVIANVDGDIFIKKIKKEPFNSAIYLISSNPNYKDIELTKENLEHFKVIAIVRGKYKVI